MECKNKFDFLKRRHHCRRCGRVCCGSCCDTRLSLPRMCFLDPVRVCAGCVKTTAKENEFYEKHLKTLITGTILTVGTDRDSNDVTLAQCRLSPDHRFLIVAASCPDNPTTLSITMNRVCGSQELATKMDNEGNKLVCGLNISYVPVGGEEEEIGLMAPAEAPLNAFSFLTALQQAVFMMHESKAVIGTGE
ncbi:zinc finger FYVE domain-containing protein 21-like isoform X2 [Oratosquilla oratoria]